VTRARSNRPKDCPYVGKGGLKLEYALREFGIIITGLTAVDLGCHIGGFTDCLLQHGALKVYSVDTAYGLLEWKLRQDIRVIVNERTNALHWKAPEQVDLVVSDLGWTRQRDSLPVIARALKPGGHALSLLKPQYEAQHELLNRGILSEEYIPAVLEGVQNICPDEMMFLGKILSPFRGNGGNYEYWLYFQRKYN
jgi:23S rRNA (cytidine1920-2'-O)/16S rRNA (cytidine1409-2'-O)-methyltransferase